MELYYNEFSDLVTINEAVNYTQLLINDVNRFEDSYQILIFAQELWDMTPQENKIYRSAVIL